MIPTAVLVLGCGFVGKVVAGRVADAGGRVVATARGVDLPVVQERGREVASDHPVAIDLRVGAKLDAASVRELIADAARAGSSSSAVPVDVVVTFPPDGQTDAAIGEALSLARRVVYLSTTGVYGAARGAVDESTPVDGSSPRARARLEAEAIYREWGAIVLRAAGIYGPGRGLHRRLLDGTFRLPGDASNVVSRIHVEDLATIILATLDRAAPASTFVVADDTPVPQREVIEWLCERLDLPLPPAVGIDEVSETLRHDRAIDNRAVKRALGIELSFPSYEEGFEACLIAEGVGARRA